MIKEDSEMPSQGVYNFNSNQMTEEMWWNHIMVAKSLGFQYKSEDNMNDL